MFPLRSQLSIATTALVFVLPVVAGVAAGGFAAGVVGIVSSFVAYDFVYVRPYYTLQINRSEDWVGLVVYSVVIILVAQLVARANRARAQAQFRAAQVGRLFELSELLVKEASGRELLGNIVSAVKAAFDLDGAALLLPEDGRLHVAASVGAPLSADEARHLSVSSAVPVSLGTGGGQQRRGGPGTTADDGGGALHAVALTVNGRAIGLLALRGAPGARKERELLGAFANHLALALERAGLREEALRARLLEEIDVLRRSLVGAVSHDLRTPLATIKVAASTLLESGSSLSPGDLKELAGLVDSQAGRLDRLVANLLDMTRIQSGALELRHEPVAVGDLVEDALHALGQLDGSRSVRWRATKDLPLVDVDPVLLRQVLANLIDNALKHSPPGKLVIITGRPLADAKVEVAVTDRGPGVPVAERPGIFQAFSRREAGGRGGLGLAIAHAFLEAHGERIWVEDGSEGKGARFAFTLPVAESFGEP